jgi:uncharacterized protein YndB with AHSA1/START domain
MFMQRDIKLKWFYNHPVETIWECLTNPEILKHWTPGGGDFKAEVGHRWMEARKPKPAMNWDGKMYFEVLEIVPMKKISYSFKGGPREGEINLDTVVTWILVPKDGGTELQLEHTGFKGPRNYFTGMIMELGWKKNVNKKFVRALNIFTNGQA